MKKLGEDGEESAGAAEKEGRGWGEMGGVFFSNI